MELPLFAAASLLRKGKQSLKEMPQLGSQPSQSCGIDLTEKQCRGNKIAALRQGSIKAFIR
jgi:hypothetical protein